MYRYRIVELLSFFSLVENPDPADLPKADLDPSLATLKKIGSGPIFKSFSEEIISQKIKINTLKSK